MNPSSHVRDPCCLIPAVGNKGRALALLKTKVKPRKVPKKRKRHELGMDYAAKDDLPLAQAEFKRRKQNPVDELDLDISAMNE
jgi:hypothetical protein